MGLSTATRQNRCPLKQTVAQVLEQSTAVIQCEGGCRGRALSVHVGAAQPACAPVRRLCACSADRTSFSVKRMLRRRCAKSPDRRDSYDGTAFRAMYGRLLPPLLDLASGGTPAGALRRGVGGDRELTEDLRRVTSPPRRVA